MTELLTINHLYVHVPFCTHICPYCSFYKLKNELPKMKEFLKAVRIEVELTQEKYLIHPQTVFWGGGTPSALSLSQLEELFSFWPWKEAEEVTFETNPDTATLDKARLLLENGITRMSLGVQAFQEKHLVTLGRTHREQDVKDCVITLRKAGFKNINIDLMFALPDQTLEEWKQTLESCVSLQPDHISCYNLTYEEDTEFFKKLSKGQYFEDEGLAEEMFLFAESFLEKAGYKHYEISNYAKPGFESIHNQAYWAGKDYLGFGPGAFSTVGSKRLHTVDNTDIYSQQLLEKRNLTQSTEELSAKTKLQEQIMLGLRTSAGMDESIFGPWKEQVLLLEKEGLMLRGEGKVYLTSKGKLVADSVALMFF